MLQLLGGYWTTHTSRKDQGVMARADLLKRLFVSYQRRDDTAFRVAAEEIVLQEREKNHTVLANELQAILANANGVSRVFTDVTTYQPVPQDADRKVALVEIRQPERYLADLVHSQEVQLVVHKLIQEFRGWELLYAHGLEPLRRVLFCGPSGCGKTVTAEAIAAELGIPLLYVRFDSVVSSLLGETASNLRKVFDYARRGQWVVFFDEFDAIARSRDDITEHGEIKRVVNSFLQLLDSFDSRSLVIAATNFEQSLDPAVWRRFDEVARFPKPNQEQLRILVAKLLDSRIGANQYIGLITDELVGGTYADAERVCLDILKINILNGGRRVTREEVNAAIRHFKYRQSLFSQVIVAEVAQVDKE